MDCLQKRRLVRHLSLAVISGLLAAILYYAFSYSTEMWVDIPKPKAESETWRLSMALAYTALTFVTVTLSIGPWYVLRHRATPMIHHALRRDIGIWTGILGLSHMLVGMLIHTNGWKIWTLFLRRLPSLSHPFPVRTNTFGFANYAGLFQASLLLLLLLISNNRVLRRLGPKFWKMLQRLNYVAFALIATHGILYQTIEQRDVMVVLLFRGVILSIIVIQLMGVLFVLFRQMQLRRHRQFFEKS